MIVKGSALTLIASRNMQSHENEATLMLSINLKSATNAEISFSAEIADEYIAQKNVHTKLKWSEIVETQPSIVS